MSQQLCDDIWEGNTARAVHILHDEAMQGSINNGYKPTNSGSEVKENTCLYWACVKNNEMVITLLLDIFHIDVNRGDAESKDTPLHKISFHGNEKMVRKLLEAGARIVLDKDMWTPVHVACRQNNIGTLVCLLEHDANSVNLRDKDWLTSLHWVAMCGHIECLKILVVLYQADYKVKDREGKTPLDYAMQYNHKDIVEFLQELERKNRFEPHPFEEEVKYLYDEHKRLQTNFNHLRNECEENFDLLNEQRQYVQELGETVFTLEQKVVTQEGALQQKRRGMTEEMTRDEAFKELARELYKVGKIMAKDEDLMMKIKLLGERELMRESNNQGVLSRVIFAWWELAL